MKIRQPWPVVLGWFFLAFAISSSSQSGADVGHDWEWVNPMPQGEGLEDFSVADSQTIFAVGTGGMVLRSDDGGLGWRILPTGTTAWLQGVDFTDPMTGSIVGEIDLAGIILRTTDGAKAGRSRLRLTWTCRTSTFPICCTGSPSAEWTATRPCLPTMAA